MADFSYRNYSDLYIPGLLSLLCDIYRCWNEYWKYGQSADRIEGIMGSPARFTYHCLNSGRRSDESAGSISACRSAFCSHTHYDDCFSVERTPARTERSNETQTASQKILRSIKDRKS